MRLGKWGNSLAVRLPAAIVRALGLKKGDDINVQVSRTGSFNVVKAASARQLLVGLRKYRGRLPVLFKFDRLEANEDH